MEKMKEYQYNVVKRLLFVMKKFWYVLLVIVMAFSALGVYSYFNGEITYTIKERVIYNATDGNSGYSSYNYTEYYFDTAVDFISQKCVLDRANYYYEEFRDWNDSVENYIKHVEEDIPIQNENVGKAENQEIFASSFTAFKYDDESFIIQIVFNDEIESVAKDKVKILILAASREARVVELGAYKYFEQAKISYIDNGLASSEMVNAGEKQLIVLVLVGFALCVLFAIIVILAHRKVTEVCELEFLTKSSVLDQIPKTKGGN